MGLAAAAGIGAVGSIVGSTIQSGAATKAAGEQATAAANALAQQKQQFGVAQSTLAPFSSAGASALPTLQSLITPGTASSTLQSLPGFQFASNWGTRQATNALTAQGLGGSTGPLASAISQYNNGLASQTYGNQVGMLQNFANMGTNAGSALAGNAINAGNSMANTIQAGGNAQAAGTLGSANALSGGLTSASGGIGNALLFSQLFGGGGGGLGNALSGIFGGTPNPMDNSLAASGSIYSSPAGPGF